MKAFIEKHKSFVSTVYTISLYIGFIWGGLKVLRLIFDSIRQGDFVSFIFAILFNSIIMMLNALLFAAIYGTIAVLILFIPYLIIRGLIR